MDHTNADGRNVDILILEPDGVATTRLTFDPSAHWTPIWSPNGKQILFSWNGKFGAQLYLKPTDGSGSEEEAAGLGAGFPVNTWDWSRDGKYVLVRKGNELWYLSWPGRVARPLLQAKWTVQNAQFSPDGRMDGPHLERDGEHGDLRLPFPSANGKWQVSSSCHRSVRQPQT